MASLENLAKNAIYNEAAADSTLWNSVGGRFYYAKAPAGSTKPYVLYSFGMTAQYTVMQNRPPVATDFPTYFDVYSSAAASTEAETIQSYIHAVFDDATLSLTGYSDVLLSRGPEVTLNEEDTGLWHVNISYMAMACRT